MSFVEPSLTFRSRASGGQFVKPPLRRPLGGVFGGAGTTVLLVHGYNTTQGDASDGYRAFLDRQLEIGPLKDKVIAVYWPGDNWEGGLYYMQAIPKARATGLALAEEIRRAAAATGHLHLKILAHSLGCRVVFETLCELSRNELPTLVIEAVVLMAAAVATAALSARDSLGEVFPVFSQVPFMSLYSSEDKVLTFAFPLGQSLAGEGFLPTALGHDRWGGLLAGGALRFTQRRVPQAKHGDYWSGSSETLPVPSNEWIRQFLDLGVPAPRSIEGRVVDERTTIDERTPHARALDGRSTATRVTALG